MMEIRNNTMPWTFGTVRIHNVGRQSDEMLPALINEEVSLAYVGQSNGMEVFNYRYRDVDLGVIASRFSRDQVLTDTWLIDWTGKTDGIRNYKDEVVIPKEIVLNSRRQIESALLTNPTWPDVFGRPYLPPRSVCFDEHDPFNWRGQRPAG
jgi:hypothetical protein